MVFNSHFEPVGFTLPSTLAETEWRQLVDTATGERPRRSAAHLTDIDAPPRAMLVFEAEPA